MAHRVLVIGGGFAGVRVVMGLARSAVDVTLVDRRNFHLFQPLLYQVATGGLSPGDIAAPLRAVVKRAKNARVLLGDVVDIDAAGHSVLLDDGERLGYDTLVVATGARHAYFGKDEWEPLAPGLKTVEDATEIRARVLSAFERAERTADGDEREASLTFVIVGGGPTGVELAGALGELARHTMRGEFRAIASERARVLLVEAGPRLLTMYSEKQSAHAARALGKLGVEVRCGVKVVGIDHHGVDLEAAGAVERVAARTVLWGAGVKASALGAALRRTAGVELDRAGRVVVEPDCTVRGHPEILVLGDLACFAHTSDRQPLPGVAPVAIQMGAYAARLITARTRARPLAPFRFVDKGTMAVIGRNEGVGRVGFGLNLRVQGFIAWLAWLFIHVLYLVDYENRVLVAIQWANQYFTRGRGARLITAHVDHPSSGLRDRDRPPA